MTPEIEAHREIHKTGHHWVDMIVAGCALVVSITSLVVAMLHGRTMERMADANARLVSANSWPLLQAGFSDQEANGEPTVSQTVANDGVGPAKIESFELFWKGRPMHDVYELLDVCCRAAASQSPAPPSTAELDLPGSPLQQSRVGGRVLRAGAAIRLYALTQTPATESLVTKLRSSAIRNVTLRACYCSVFDECWVSDLRTLHPQRVQHCAAPAVPFLTR